MAHGMKLRVVNEFTSEMFENVVCRAQVFQKESKNTRQDLAAMDESWLVNCIHAVV